MKYRQREHLFTFQSDASWSDIDSFNQDKNRRLKKIKSH